MPKFGTLTKARVVAAVVETTRYTQKKGFKTVKTMLGLIKRSLEPSAVVLISDFGKLCVKKKQKRRGRNPDTGKDTMLPPRQVVTFEGSEKLRTNINDT